MASLRPSRWTFRRASLFTATENYIHAGSLYGVDSPILSATLEIDGKKADVGTGLSDPVQSFLGQPGVANQESRTASSASNSMLLDVSASPASAGNIPFTIDVPLAFNLDSSVIGGGEAFFNMGAMSTSLSLAPTQLIYQSPSPKGVVPMLLSLVGRS